MTGPAERAGAPDTPERGCSIPGCPRRHRARGFCGAHYLRWSRHGEPAGGEPSRCRTGPGYGTAHRRIRAVRGPAGGWACAGCGAPAVVWSYDGTDPDERTEPGRGRVYSPDPDRYRPCCRSCHRLALLRADRPGGCALDVERAARLYRAGATSRGIAALLGVSRSTVLTALRAHGVAIRAPGPRRGTDPMTAPIHRTSSTQSSRDLRPTPQRQRSAT